MMQAQHTNPFTIRAVLTVSGVSYAVALLTEDVIAGAALSVLWLIWTVLPKPLGLPILPLALTFQWMQDVIGIYYYELTGRMPTAMERSNYQPMVWMSLGGIVALVVGLRLGNDLLARRHKFGGETHEVPWDYLLVAYVIAVVSKPAFERYVWTFADLNQGMLALGYLRLGLFYIILRRLIQKERYLAATGLLTLEIFLGFTGFYAEFREPIMIAFIVGWEVFDRKRAAHWMAVVCLTGACLGTALVWMGIRTDVRGKIGAGTVGTTVQDRLRMVNELSTSWWYGGGEDKLIDADGLVNRLWDVYYPALAASRVPSVLPHENGALLLHAISHVFTPRAFFPDKQALDSDSVFVRKYSGVYVAGPEQGTSIAFGYTIEAYIDFGVPMMFLPIFAFGALMGAAFFMLTTWIHDREVAIGAATVVFWLALSPANREWARMLGMSGTLLIFVGGAAFLVDRYLSSGSPDRPGSTTMDVSEQFPLGHV